MNTELRIGIDITSDLTHWEVYYGYPWFSKSIYVLDMLDGLCRNGHAGQMVVFTYRWAEEFLRARFPGIHIVCVGNRLCDTVYRVSGKNIYRHLNMCPNIARTINVCDMDLLWNPFLSVGDGKREIRHRTVETIHDLIEYHPNESADGCEAFRHAIASADRLVTISEYVKRECIEAFDFPEDRISVIPNAIQFQDVQEEPVPNLAPGYILDINGYREHKNTITLIRAFERIKDQTDCDLVLCAGSRDEAYYTEMLREIEARRLQNRVTVLYHLSKAQIEWLYNHARLYVNPSLMEGFGRGPVEAALHSVPVLTSKETSLYEITKGLLEYMTNPRDDEEIARSMLRIITNGPSYDMQQVKEIYLKEYTPEAVSVRLWELFEKMAVPFRENTSAPGTSGNGGGFF